MVVYDSVENETKKCKISNNKKGSRKLTCAKRHTPGTTLSGKVKSVYILILTTKNFLAWYSLTHLALHSRYGDETLEIRLEYLFLYSAALNRVTPFSTAVPFWGQLT